MIGIFKTNISTHNEREQMIDAIHSHFDVATCHVDIEDCDKVLRITEMKVEEAQIIDFVQERGFICEVLE